MGHVVHLVNSCRLSCPHSLQSFLCPRKEKPSPVFSLAVVMLNCCVTSVHGVGRNNIYQKTYQLTQRGENYILSDMQTLQGHRSKKRLMCLNAWYMFFPATLAGLIKYVSCSTFRVERAQEPVTVIRSALH